MTPTRKWLALAVAAASAALVVAAVLPGAAPAATAAAPHANGIVRIVHRGLVRDCEYIENSPDETDADIVGNGVNKPVTLTYGTPACFNLYNEFHYSYDGKTFTGYQYQNTAGHCLWSNNTSHIIELGVACNSTDTSEDFFALPGSYAAYGGWVVSDVAEWPGDYLMDSPVCEQYAEVAMQVAGPTCPYWNFPSG
jgi:hypothetical protein